MKRLRASFNLALLAGAFLLHSPSAEGAEQPGPLTGDKAIEQLKSTGQYDSLRSAMTGARYGVKTDREHIATAANPAHGIFSTFTPAGLRMEVRTGDATDAPVHTVTWRLESLGYGAARRPVPAGALKTEGARVELVRAIGIEKATLVTNFMAFPMTAPQTTINAAGKLEFQFTAPDNAAFYRLEAR